MIKIKLLSVNEAWQGRRFKTRKYKVFERELFYILPDITIPEGKLELSITVGISSGNADIDNIAKPAIDVMQKRYDFNDKRIHRLVLEKQIVKKGDEYFTFKFKAYD